MKLNIKFFLTIICVYLIFINADLYAQTKTTKLKTERETTTSSSEKIANEEYYKGYKIITGPKGGRYYINSNGNKTYIHNATTKSSASSTENSDDGEYYNGHEVLTGPRGGKYYINSHGNKTYLKH